MGNNLEYTTSDLRTRHSKNEKLRGVLFMKKRVSTNIQKFGKFVYMNSCILVEENLGWRPSPNTLLRK